MVWNIFEWCEHIKGTTNTYTCADNRREKKNEDIKLCQSFVHSIRDDSRSTSAASSAFEVAACRSSDAAIRFTDAMLLYFMSLKGEKRREGWVGKWE